MRASIFFLFLVALCGCGSVSDLYKPVTETILLKDSGPVRAVLVDGDKIWFGGIKKYGWINHKTGESKQWSFDHPSKPDFRSIAKTDTDIFLLNAGTPAWLLRVDKKSQTVDTVYTESAQSTFYDAMSFRDKTYGIAVGDPVDGAFSILETFDGGKSWKRRPASESPIASEGEAAFAASNSNLLFKDGSTYLVSGGKKSRLLKSSGKTWETFETPIVQGKTMTGIFTFDFFDADNGIIAGGDYEQPISTKSNKAVTNDGGKTWKLVSDGEGFGYTSCIQYVPGTKGKNIVAVGATGLWVSKDGGQTWRKGHAETNWNTIRFIDSKTAVVGGRTNISLLKFQ